MTRAYWCLLLALTALNCGAAAVTLQSVAQARADFRSAAEPIAKLGAAIFEQLARLSRED